MSSKSSAQPEVHTQGIFNRKFGIAAAIVIIVVFFVTISYYPLILGPEKAPPAPPATQVK